ncbi:hypothetical protein A7X95_02625 [Candidatus Nitrosopelagicus brevis]|uniref:Uncharacterized protein n=2 Tax=Candidatus Nitrosopelagicus brevis TaxID=1410606 RepID=A0A2R6TC06_9ARCH|nr:hypothetical protein A7X95_02625 [Candidatus Nitrosopelagicus brevis]
MIYVRKEVQTNMKQISEIESEVEEELPIFICDADEHMLDPLETIKYSLNEIQLTYGSVVKVRDAP